MESVRQPRVAAGKLVDTACQLADQLDVKYLELRHEAPFDHPKFNFERRDKFHMRLPLPGDSSELMGFFKAKLRSQVKKSFKGPLDFRFAGLDGLDDFYNVFATRMRDLGTPVFPKNLFRKIIVAFDGDAEFCIVNAEKQIAAAALIVHRNGVTEVPSAGCKIEFNRFDANMFMYWQLMVRAIGRKSDVFDFGRSSEGSGTYKFKKQWKSEPHAAVWQYYVRKGDPNQMRPDSGGKKKLVEIWKRLPVWMTRIIGPAIVKGIP